MKYLLCVFRYAHAKCCVVNVLQKRYEKNHIVKVLKVNILMWFIVQTWNVLTATKHFNAL